MIIPDLEMAVNSCFSSILNAIQLSNLNFKIERTPCAALITLKKTVLKDKNGVPATPSPPIIFHLQQAQQDVYNLQLENAQLTETVRNWELEAEELNKAYHDVSNELEKAFEDLGKSKIKNNEILKVAEKKGS